MKMAQQKTLGDLNEILFYELERLAEADGEEAVRIEVSRAKAIKDMSETVLENSRVAMEAVALGASISGQSVAKIAAPLTLSLASGA